MCLEASTKAHVHQKFEIFWTNIASTMTNFKNGPKKGLGPLAVKGYVCDIHVVTLSEILFTNHSDNKVQDFTVDGGKQSFHFYLFPTWKEVYI
jgi:hypothetical protein